MYTLEKILIYRSFQRKLMGTKPGALNAVT